MQILKTYGVGALVALVVALGVSYSVKQENIDIVEKIVEQVKSLGATPGTTFLSECVTFNGLDKCSERKTLTQASSTVASFGVQATSTLEGYQCFIHNATGTALSLGVGKGANKNNTATTTNLFVNSDENTYVAIGAQSKTNIRFSETYFATSSAELAVNSDLVFGPNDRLNIRVGGAAGDIDAETAHAVTYANYAPVGSCGVDWRVN